MFKKWFGGSSKKEEKKQQADDESDVPDDSELEKQGFDPEKLEVDDEKEEPLLDFTLDYPGYQICNAEEIHDQVAKYMYVPAGEEVRTEIGDKKGGLKCIDEGVKKKMRSVGKEMVKQIGKKIISGSFNLTKVSFPIKAMIPKTVLETSMYISCMFPVLLNKAVQQKDPLERLKLTITTCLSSFYWTNTFLKPLNPILGETLIGYFNDGTQVFGEQISHHPPISYFLIIGPNNSYKYTGYYDYDAKAGLNSISIMNKGKRCIEFTDTKQKISFDFPNEQYSGTFLGTMKQESIGKMTFQDLENGLEAQVILGKVKKKPSDFFDGQIIKDGKVTSKIYGTYLGFIDFDGIRYWQYDNLTPHTGVLESDHHLRADLQTLKRGDLAFAQKEKERMEEEQRADRKIREEYVKKQEKRLKQEAKEQKELAKKK